MVDFTCVRHGRWLRLLGIDTEIVKSLNDIKKKIEERILITRNKKFRKIFRENVLLVPEMNFWKAMNFIIKHLSLENEIKPFTRCSLCNEQVREISKNEVKGKVPYYVYENFNSFHICPKCNKIYWGGSHYERFLEDIKNKIGIKI
jgi:uncharacterized protein with PIN domain